MNCTTKVVELTVDERPVFSVDDANEHLRIFVFENLTKSPVKLKIQRFDELSGLWTIVDKPFELKDSKLSAKIVNEDGEASGKLRVLASGPNTDAGLVVNYLSR